MRIENMVAARQILEKDTIKDEEVTSDALGTKEDIHDEEGNQDGCIVDHGEDENMKHLEDEIRGYGEDVGSVEYVQEDPKEAFNNINEMFVTVFSMESTINLALKIRF